MKSIKNKLNFSNNRKNKTQKKRIYSEKDYKSNDGMLTSVWGPSMWHTLHTISFNYPVKPSLKEKRNYRQFILNLKHILPCGKCRQNFEKNMKDLPILMKHMQSRSTFSRYVYDLHELINKMLNKESNLTYSDVRERYEHFRARCKSQKEISENAKVFKENGCIEPLKGKKSKCVLKIVPEDEKCDTFQVNITKM